MVEDCCHSDAKNAFPNAQLPEEVWMEVPKAVLAENPEECAEEVKVVLTKHLYSNVKVIKHKSIGEIIHVLKHVWTP